MAKLTMPIKHTKDTQPGVRLQRVLHNISILIHLFLVVRDKALFGVVSNAQEALFLLIVVVVVVVLVLIAVRFFSICFL